MDKESKCPFVEEEVFFVALRGSKGLRFSSWSFAVLRGPSWFFAALRGPSWIKGFKVFFVALRGPSWIRGFKVFFVVLRGPSRPFVDQRV